MLKQETFKAVGDIVSVATVSGAMMQVLPPVASVLTIIWVFIRILETRTVRKCLGKSNKTRSDDA